jgi:aerobic carbon-monoxide dehydrogenase medium subunit
MWNLAEIQRPTTLAEAVRLLRRPNVKTAILAGGTTLVPQARRDVQSLVDLRDLKLAYIKREGNTLRIGAATTLQDIVESSDVLPALAQTARDSAPINVRNVATMGGVAASAGFGAPLPVALLALDAVLVIYSPEARQSPIAAFLAYREKLLRDGALITEVGIPLTDARIAFEKVARTPGDAPIVCAVAKLRLAEVGNVARDVRVAVGGVGPTPVRLARAEQTLEGKPLTESLIAQAAEAAAKEVNPPSDFLASSEYRREMVKVLVKRTITETWRNA